MCAAYLYDVRDALMDTICLDMGKKKRVVIVKTDNPLRVEFHFNTECCRESGLKWLSHYDLMSHI